MDELLRADVSQKCPECRGHGADPLSDNLNWLPCRSCGGTGTLPPSGQDIAVEPNRGS